MNKSHRKKYLAAFRKLDAEKAKRKPIAVFDMETDNGQLLGNIAGIAFTSDIDFPHVHEFSIMEDFLTHYLVKRYRGFIAYAHKGMSFDLSHLLSSMSIQKWIMRNGFTVHVDRSFVIIRKAKHSWFFGDSLRVIPVKLEDVLNVFVPHRTKAILPTEPFSWNHQGWRARITEDTLGLYEALKNVEKIIGDIFEIPLSITMPATALRAARTMIPFEAIPRPPQKALDWIRSGAYSGGRIEIYQQGKIHGPIYCFDINSAYAWALKGEFPIGKGIYKKKEPQSGYFIARCSLDVPSLLHIPPVLSRLFIHAFAVGQFQAFLTKEEIEFARECGARVTVIECWAWKRTHPLFRSFIQRCEFLRKKDYTGPLGQTVKLMQNGLYGILGMNPFRKVQLLSLEPPKRSRTRWIDAFDMMSGTYVENVYETTDFKESPNQMPHWAAIVTARVRVHLSRYLILFEQCGLTPLYAHTDSIWTTSQNGIPQQIKEHVSEHYGELKLERKGDLAIIVCPGEAAMRGDNGEWHLVAKGWRPKDADIFTREKRTRIEQVQIFRAGTAMKKRSPGRVISKLVMNYQNMSNRIPARSRPGPTMPKTAAPYAYDYWRFDTWYIGKTLQDRPSPKRFRLTSPANRAHTIEERP